MTHNLSLFLRRHTQTTHAAPATFHAIAALVVFIRAYKAAGVRPGGGTVGRCSYLTWPDVGPDLSPPPPRVNLPEQQLSGSSQTFGDLIALKTLL